MNLEKVVFAFFIILSLTATFGFVVGDFGDQDHHNVYELFAAVVVNLIATVLKFGDRSHIGAVLLATSLVADLHLIIAGVVWALATGGSGLAPGTAAMGAIVSLASGALLANGVSVILLVSETIQLRR
ncbi:MAG: DUF6394 family protein [Gammaproteobacteria bacterium]|jgi:hypothetical protein|nr:DUF6394 family protein [Gammaproteobacteria bacterium]